MESPLIGNFNLNNIYNNQLTVCSEHYVRTKMSLHLARKIIRL